MCSIWSWRFGSSTNRASMSYLPSRGEPLVANIPVGATEPDNPCVESGTARAMPTPKNTDELKSTCRPSAIEADHYPCRAVTAVEAV